MFHPDLNSYSCEISELTARGYLLDPWERRLDMMALQRHLDVEGEITHWSTRSIVAGDTVVDLTIYND